MILFFIIIVGITAAILSLFAAVMLVSIILNLITRVPYAPTPQAHIEQIFNHIQLKPGQRLYDLGCGDGRVVFAAANRGAHATGFEIQPLTYLRAKMAQIFFHPTADIRFSSFRHANLTDADVIFCFLVDKVMADTATFLNDHAPRDCTIISYGFPLPGWQTTTRLESGLRGSKTYLYRKDG